MKKSLAVAGALIATFTAAPSLASESRPTTISVIKILPNHHVFHDGDPIRICVGMETSRLYSGTAKMAIEWKNPARHDGWQSTRVDIDANRVGCMYAVVHGSGDVVFRSRTLNTEDYVGSVSHRVHIDAA